MAAWSESVRWVRPFAERFADHGPGGIQNRAGRAPPAPRAGGASPPGADGPCGRGRSVGDACGTMLGLKCPNFDLIEPNSCVFFGLQVVKNCLPWSSGYDFRL